jgi:uncharacterized protein (UPF0332 family)
VSEDGAVLLDDAARSIEAAELLLQRGFADFATSRAYYAMFYAAQALLASRGLSFSKHGAVVAKFGEFFAKTGALPSALHRYLIDAFGDRQSADYEHRRETPAYPAETHIAHAREFLAAARGYLDGL